MFGFSKLVINTIPEMAGGASTTALFLNGRELDDSKQLGFYPEISVVQVNKKNNKKEMNRKWN